MWASKRVSVRQDVIENIDTANRRIDTIGSTMIGSMNVNKDGVDKMIDKSREVSRLLGDLYD